MPPADNSRKPKKIVKKAPSKPFVLKSPAGDVKSTKDLGRAKTYTKRIQREVKDVKSNKDLSRGKNFKPKKGRSGLAAIDLTGQSGILKDLQKGSSKLGNKIAPQGAAIINPIGSAIQHVPGLKKVGKLSTEVSKNLVKDAVNLPAGVVPSVYMTGRAGVKAVKGDPKELKGIWKEMKEHDPIVLTGRGIVEGKSKHFGKALKEAKEHPGFTAVEVAGLKGVGGRLAGKAPGVKPRSSRPNIKDPHSKFEVERAYSPDLITRKVQKVADKKMSPKREAKILQRGMNKRVDQLVDVERGARDKGLAKAQLKEEMGRGKKKTLPESTTKRLEQHRKIDDPDYGVKIMRKGTSIFSRSVLPFSPSWYAGNAVEGTLRAGLQKAGPISHRKFNKTVKELEKSDPKAAQELKHFGGHGQGQMFADDLDRKVPKIVRKPSDKLFRANQKFIESPALKSVMGKSMKELGYSAKDMKNPTRRAKVIEEAHRHYGKYSGFGPEMRKGKSTYAPFAAWPVNAAKFLARLPEDHPLFSLTTTANNRAQDKNLKKEGLRFGEKGQKPLWLLGTVPTKKGSVPASRYTPFSLGVDPIGAGKGFVPLLKPLMDAASGKDWKGQPIKPFSKEGSAGPPEQAAYALREYAKSMIPGAGTGSRVIQKGPEALNPFAPIRNKKKDKKKKGGSIWDEKKTKKSIWD